MKRNPQLAQEVSKLPEIASARHVAIDKVTSAHLAVDLLSRSTSRNLNAVEELEIEEKALDLMADAVYFFRKYMRLKQSTYDKLIHEQIEIGNDKIKQHSRDLKELAARRGLET